MKNRINHTFRSLVWTVLLLGLTGGITAAWGSGAKAEPAQLKTGVTEGEDPGPVYTQMIYQWAKTTNFAQNAAEVIVGKLKMDMQSDPKLQKVLTPRFVADLEQFFYELFLSPETIKELAKLYSQYFTLDEMQELLVFYKSPVGQKLIKLDPELKIKTQQIGSALLKRHEKDYMQLIAKHIVVDKEKLQQQLKQPTQASPQMPATGR